MSYGQITLHFSSHSRPWHITFSKSKTLTSKHTFTPSIVSNISPNKILIGIPNCFIRIMCLHFKEKKMKNDNWDSKWWLRLKMKKKLTDWDWKGKILWYFKSWLIKCLISFWCRFTLYIIYNSKFYSTTIMKNGPNSNVELIVNI